MANIPNPVTGAFGGYTPGSMMVAAGAYGVDFVGDMSVDHSITSAMEYGLVDVIVGSLSVEVVPAAAFQHNFGYEIVTTLEVIESINSVMVYNRNASIQGNAAIEVNVVSDTEHGAVFTGYSSIELSITSIMNYNRHASLTGDILLSQSILSDMLFWNYERIEPSSIVLTGAINGSVDINSGSILPTVDTDTGSIDGTFEWPQI